MVYTLKILYKHIVSDVHDSFQTEYMYECMHCGMYSWMDIYIYIYIYHVETKEGTSCPIQYGASRTPWKLIEFESKGFCSV